MVDIELPVVVEYSPQYEYSLMSISYIGNIDCSEGSWVVSSVSRSRMRPFSFNCTNSFWSRHPGRNHPFFCDRFFFAVRFFVVRPWGEVIHKSQHRTGRRIGLCWLENLPVMALNKNPNIIGISGPWQVYSYCILGWGSLFWVPESPLILCNPIHPCMHLQIPKEPPEFSP